MAAKSAQNSQTDTPPSSRVKSRTLLLATAFAVILFSISMAMYINGANATRYKAQYGQIHKWVQSFKTPISITEAELATFDGTNGKPIYLAVNGTVYDVSASPELYGPGGSYSFFSAKDGARAYITGCFSTDLTHDLRGIPEEQWIELEAWKTFYETSTKYFKVGTVMHPPIDPRTTPPAPCNAQKMN